MKWYSEQNLIDNVARFIPWLAPAIPATFAYINSTNPDLLNMQWYIGVLIALTVEGLGLAAIHTSLSLIEFIKTHSKNQPKTEAWIMLAMTGFYLVVIVLVNIILDLQHPPEIIAAKALLSLVSIPAAVTLSIRQLHKIRLTNEAEQKAEKTAQGRLGALTKEYSKLKQTNAELKQTIQGLHKQITEQNKQTKQANSVTKIRTKTANKQKNVELIECPDCGTFVKGVKGLNGHSRFCTGKQDDTSLLNPVWVGQNGNGVAK